jgi:hypothetical protein
MADGAVSQLASATCAKCGREYQCTVYGLRAGRKYCSGACQDNRSAEAVARRRAATREWKRKQQGG